MARLGWRVRLAAPCFLALAACSDENAARQELAKGGYTDVALQKAASSMFGFTGTKDGADCQGTIRFSGISIFGWPRKKVEIVASCDPIAPDCDEEHAAVCTEQGDALDQGDPAKAMDRYRTGCGGGDALSCTHLGEHYEAGRGAAKDGHKAVELYERGCDAKSALACERLGHALDAGLGGKRDEAGGVKAHTKSCDLGFMAGCLGLAADYEQGRGCDADLPRARSLYESECTASARGGCLGLAQMLAHAKGGSEDKPRAEKLLSDQCDASDAPSCGALAELLHDKVLVDASVPMVAIAAKGCRLGSGVSCFEAGAIREAGDGGEPRSDGNARSFYEEGCNMSSPLACLHAAMFAQAGRGGASADPDRARSLFEKACNLGEAQACRTIGVAAPP